MAPTRFQDVFGGKTPTAVAMEPHYAGKMPDIDPVTWGISGLRPVTAVEREPVTANYLRENDPAGLVMMESASES